MVAAEKASKEGSLAVPFGGPLVIDNTTTGRRLQKLKREAQYGDKRVSRQGISIMGI